MKRNKALLSALTLALITPAIVLPTQVDATTPSFDDVPKTHPYYKEINAMAATGIIKGNNGKFNPEANVTRAQAASFTLRAANLYNLRIFDSQNIGITDISPQSEHSKGLQMLVNALLLIPKNNKIEPDKPLTRGEMALILEHTFNLTFLKEHPLTDVSPLYTEAVSALYEAGITTGNNGKFNENEPVSRQNYAVFMSRAIEYFNNYPKRDYVTINDSYREANNIILHWARYTPKAGSVHRLNPDSWKSLSTRQFYASTLPAILKENPDLYITGINGHILLKNKNWTNSNTKGLFAQIQIYVDDNFADFYFDPYENNSFEIIKRTIIETFPEKVNKQVILTELEKKYNEIKASGSKERNISTIMLDKSTEITHGLYNMDAKVPQHHYYIKIQF